MAKGQDKKYVVESIRAGGWGLYDVKRSMTLPVAVFGQGDNDLADLVCAFVNSNLTIEDILDTDPKVPDEDDLPLTLISVDKFLHSISERG